MLRKGDFGRAVARVQRKLHISADGVFGNQTQQAVKRFQRSKGLQVGRRGRPQDAAQART